MFIKTNIKSTSNVWFLASNIFLVWLFYLWVLWCWFICKITWIYSKFYFDEQINMHQSFHSLRVCEKRIQQVFLFFMLYTDKFVTFHSLLVYFASKYLSFRFYEHLSYRRIYVIILFVFVYLRAHKIWYIIRLVI